MGILLGEPFSFLLVVEAFSPNSILARGKKSGRHIGDSVSFKGSYYRAQMYSATKAAERAVAPVPKNSNGNPLALCKGCGKYMITTSINRHLRKMHPELAPPIKNLSAEELAKRKEEVVWISCPCCQKRISKKALKKHFEKQHPNEDHERVKALIIQKSYQEDVPEKRAKTSDLGENVEDAPVSHIREAPQQCACGLSFSRKVSYQVHETLFHKNFTGLKRCEFLGCFGLFLNSQLHDLHKASVHRAS